MIAMASVLPLAALVSAAAAALASYLVAARKLSGKIKTTDADALWAEAEKLRRQYREDIASFREQLKDCLDRVSALERQNEELHGENGDLRKKVKALEAENESLRTEIVGLKARLAEVEVDHA